MLADALRSRYSGVLPGDADVLKRVSEACKWYLSAGLGDDDAENRLSSPQDAIYWQQLSEVMIARELAQHGLAPLRRRDSPDFLVEHEGHRIWIEVICPEPRGVPSDWLDRPTGQAISLPHEEILLRWTSAIKEKFEKLTGKPEKVGTGYIAKGVVKPSDRYVIAVNGRLLRGAFPQITDISQYPFAVEATLAVGPWAMRINVATQDVVDTGLQHRPMLPKPNGSPVPADTFFDPRYTPVSAVWAVDFDVAVLFARPQPSILVHNHASTNRVRAGLLPVQSEYVATIGEDDYTLQRRDGRLATPPG
jgi:hypothetical protein